jgi:5-methylcytosine-specific restriction endonuclease McrA
MYIRNCIYCRYKFPILEMIVVYAKGNPQSVCEGCYLKRYGKDNRYEYWKGKYKKKCPKCEKAYPATEAYFHWYRGKPAAYCRDCSSEISQNRMEKRRAEKLNIENPCTYKEWVGAIRNFDYECAYCGEKGRLWQDHVKPLSKDGEHRQYNIVPCCKRCNTKKSIYDMETWYKKQNFFKQQRLDKIKEWQAKDEAEIKV